MKDQVEIRLFKRPPRDSEVEPDDIHWLNDAPYFRDGADPYAEYVRVEVYDEQTQEPLSLHYRKSTLDQWHHEVF